MKLAGLLTVGATQAASTINQVKSMTNVHKVCGVTSGIVGHNVTVHEEIELGPGESCIYRFKGDNEHDFEIKDFNIDVPCEFGEISLWQGSKGEEVTMLMGPTCIEGPGRKRRDAYGATPSDMQGQSFKSKEMDMVISNGQRARFRFGFNFEFELMPGLPMAGHGGNGQCPYKGIKAANGAFYAQYPDNAAANDIFNQLTESMYKFNCYFDQYRTQCRGNGPVTVSCHLMDFSPNSHKPIIDKVEAIIHAQCAQCHAGNGSVCTEWYMLLSQLKYACKHNTDYQTPAPCGPDECYDGTDDCGPNTVCTNTCEGYECTCADGFYAEEDGSCCDAKQCEVDNGGCGENANCIEQCDGNTCECKDGFHIKYGQCVPVCDEDQCATGNNNCDDDATCTNECQGYTCTCNDGFYGDGTKCCDENQCDGYHGCDINAHCVDKCHGHKCVCNDGFYGNGYACCDEDQCAYNNGGCPEYSTCSNDCIGRTCTCDEGYHFEDDICVPDCDEDQCATGNNDCHADAVCKNKCDGYTCKCKPGFYGSGTECCDEDQCATGNNDCHADAVCTNECAGYTCKCKPGYYGSGTECCDEDQCATGNNDCDVNAACTNQCAGYTCECNDGFYGNGKKCCDEDQCATGNNDCHADAVCTNQCIGYTCECKAGFYGSGTECCDEDQCATGNNNCHPDATCTDACSGFVCECKDGFYGTGTECCDENQCESGANDCHADAVCIDQCAGYKCECKDGFYGSGKECCDADQCAGDDHDCDVNASCINECSGYTCKCNKGFFGDGKECCDVDQCLTDNGGCGAYAVCNNLCIGRECVCVEGYHMVGNECVPICDENQCKGDNKCGDYTNCINKCDGYECECKNNYIPVPGTDYPTGVLNCEHSNKCHGVKCPAYSKCRDGTCYCNNGYYQTEDGKCKAKVNECLTGKHNCGKYSTCTDTLTGFTCACNDGYADVNGDGTKCIHPYYQDQGMCYLNQYAAFTNKKFEKIAFKTAYGVQEAIDAWETITAELTHLGEVAQGHRTVECDPMAGYIGCGHIDYSGDETACEWAHSLENVITVVQEKCSQGWEDKFAIYLNTLRKNSCDEPDDCANNLHNCSPYATCVPKKAVYGKKTSGYKCMCNEGYYGPGTTCFPEKDECALNIHRCHKDAICVDKSAGYDCKCKTGFVGNGYKCQLPVDECALNLHDCSKYATCTDLENGFFCKCKVKEGYTGDGRICTGPADECLEGNHLCHTEFGECTNTYAGYTCKCQEGFLGDGKKCWPPLTCPWLPDTNYGTYGGDWDGMEGTNGLCSLKYAKVCWNNLYQDLIKGGMFFCKKNDAFSQFKLLMNDLFSLGKIYDQKFHPAKAHYAAYATERYGAECDPVAGAVPCDLIDFHNIVDAADLYNRVEKLVSHVYGQCSKEYEAKWQLWLARYYNALICPVNECKTGDYTCHANAKCIDRAKGYDCKCTEHYEGNGFDNCTPIDYCSVIPPVCNQYSNCVTGEYGVGHTCECKPGYAGPKCLPVDPCLEDNGGCDANANCISTIIGYDANHICKCKMGYYGSGKVCQAIDPCEYHNCDINAVCVPNAVIVDEEDYECKCKDGWKGNGYFCEEYKNPCDDVVCIAEAHCEIVTSQYGHEAGICVCNDGFKGNGQVCNPKEPCEDHDCHPLAICTPLGGYGDGHICTCKDGLEGDGVDVCVSPNPCDNCDQYAVCKPKFGYSGAEVMGCVCKQPYIGDGLSCRIGKPCKNKCPKGTNCADGKCLCPSYGLWYDWGKRKCMDKDECNNTKLNNCSPNASCKNKFDGFTCTCNPGFVGDGVTCIKKDGGEVYTDSGNPYVTDTSNIPDMVNQNQFHNADGTNINLFANFNDGECSVMGYNWVTMGIWSPKMKWVSKMQKERNLKWLNTLFTEFQSLGKSVLVRQQPSCDTTVAGKIDCKLLYFPETDHRCQLVQRIEKVFLAIAQSCNASWIKKYGDLVDKVAYDNQAYKQGLPCPDVEWL